MCPVGDVRGVRESTAGLMSLDLFKQIADKLVNENITIDNFYIGNWGEAMLNPDLWKIVRYAKQVLNPKQILVNSNFSLTIKEPELLLMSGVTDIRASVSGMTQEIYEKNHSGGNIERILENLKILSSIKRDLNLTLPNIAMVYHEYLYNQHENEPAIRFCQEHGIDFMPIRCYPCSLEEGIKFHQDPNARDSYKDFINIDEEISRMRTIPDEVPCGLVDQIVINHNGSVFKCCGTYTNKNSLGNIFDWKIKDLLAHYPPLCTLCKSIPLSWR
jgi:MoaA/NifB/PqqE/SkfB family radical SAM enzyme